MEKYLGIYYFCTVNVCAARMTTKILIAGSSLFFIYYFILYCQSISGVLIDFHMYDR